MPAPRIFGRRGVGNAPTPDTRRGKGGSAAATSFTTRQTAGNSRSSTSPRNRSVTCMLSGVTHFTSAPVFASVSWSATALSRMSAPISTAMNVRVRGMRNLRRTAPRKRAEVTSHPSDRLRGTVRLLRGLSPELFRAVVESRADLRDDLHRKEVRGAGGLLRRDAVRQPVQERAGEHVAGAGQVHGLARERRDVE